MRILIHTPATLLVIVLSSLGSSGCGSGHDKLEKNLAELREQVVRIQSAQDRLEERLIASEMQRRTAAKVTRSNSTKTESAPSGRPRLKVIQLQPDSDKLSDSAKTTAEADANSEKADSKAPRPLITTRGKGKVVVMNP